MAENNGLFTNSIDIDGNNDLPVWIRNAIDTITVGLGVGTHPRKAAAEEVIENLQPALAEDLSESLSECPICYEDYESTEVTKDHDLERYGTRFNDPSLYFPCDELAGAYCRYPVRNLVNKITPSDEDLLPGISSIESPGANKDYPHIPVKMPNCNHVFGKSCIVEWLKEHVSCPLCRKEVESEASLAPKTRAKKRALIRERSSTFYNEEKEMIEHLTERLTDVFHPFRRPTLLRVVPLTDGSLEQVAAQNVTQRNKGTPDPALVIPKALALPGRRNLETFLPLSVPYLPNQVPISAERMARMNNRPDIQTFFAPRGTRRPRPNSFARPDEP